MMRRDDFFDWHNARGATVHDLDRGGEKVERVLTVDVVERAVAVHDVTQPYTPLGPAIRDIHFDVIWPIYGGQDRPVMFQCMGRHE